MTTLKLSFSVTMLLVSPSTIGASEASSARAAELEAVIQNLREQLWKTIGINDVTWETVCAEGKGRRWRSKNSTHTIPG